MIIAVLVDDGFAAAREREQSIGCEASSFSPETLTLNNAGPLGIIIRDAPIQRDLCRKHVFDILGGASFDHSKHNQTRDYKHINEAAQNDHSSLKGALGRRDGGMERWREGRGV